MKNAAKAAVVAGSMSSLISACERQSHSSDYDIVIRNGKIYDGSLDSPYNADIGIKKDKIDFIGIITGNAAKTINAEGLIITPGFIDIHTHCDLTFKRLGMKRYLAHFMPSWKGNYNYLYQGVTAVVTGNCGYGYSDLNAWFDIADGVEFGSNVYTLVPHGAIRLELFGENQPGQLNRRQLDMMKVRIEEEMEKGAVGVSTGLAFPPGSNALTEELIEISKVVRKYNGIYATHIRDESGTLDDQGRTAVEKAVKEAIEIGRRAEISVEISHLKIDSPINHKTAQTVLEPIEKARGEGLNITADQYPYNAGAQYLTVLLPNNMKQGDKITDDFKTKSGRESIKYEIDKEFSHMTPDKILVTWDEENEKNEGKTLAEVSELEKRSPVDVFTEMVCADDPPMGVFFSQDINVVKDIMSHDFIITASDGWTIPKDMMKPHPRLYGTFPRKLRKYVIDEERLSLVSAIRSMTSLPAEKFKMKNRGRLIEGNFADIAIINLKKITDRATYVNPHQYAEGIEYLLINGGLAIENGKATGTRFGKSVRMI
ncbi:D-aminoacylase [bacterium]|nr:D-aminoacylase [bacterium]